jgi:hypothetical protein
MKNIISCVALVAALILSNPAKAQTSGAITVGGAIDKFYPVTWYDGNWPIGNATEIQIARPDVHENSSWRGALMSKFSFHVSNWGHGASFIDPYIRYNVTPFVGGWRDASWNNGDRKIIIWLKGGGTTYHYTANTSVTPVIYDGVQNALPYVETNGPSHSYKMAVDSYVNSNGETQSGDINSTGTGYFASIGIDTKTVQPGYKVTVNGKIIAEEVNVVVDVPADYVFDSSYELMPLSMVSKFINTEKHLPGIPSAAQLKQNGWQVGAMNNKLLEKVEELTLYLIEMERKNLELTKKVEALEALIKK